MADLHIKNVLICEKPEKKVSPLVLDSPHSGSVYPPDFRHSCPRAWLRETEDAFVDELFKAAPGMGFPFLRALFPRSYIDVNRAEDDIDPRLLAGFWTGSCRTTARSEAGVGLIRRVYRQRDPRPIYDRLLPPGEIRARIDTYYRPYHQTLAEVLDETHALFGRVYHLNCHSMPTQDNPAFQCDFVLGDRDGTSCEPAFTRFVENCLGSMGYKVLVNTPYKGVEILRRYGRPPENRHSLQIEILRTLYMDEKTGEKTGGFSGLNHNMEILLGKIAAYAGGKSGLDSPLSPLA